jgi:alpha-L-rhamnosidase
MMLKIARDFYQLLSHQLCMTATLSCFFMIQSFSTFSQMQGNAIPLNFTADWITYPGIHPKEYGVYHLRKTFELAAKPSSFIVHLSGDQRYRLLVNGSPACFGPARGDLRNWNYETIDLAPFLKSGKNVLAVQLWNMGSGAPAAQISYQTAFILQGNSEREKIVNTNNSWKIIKNEGYFPEPFPAARLASYIVGSCDSVDFNRYPMEWEKENLNDQDWKSPSIEPKGRYYNEKRRLVPRSIPMMEEKEEPIVGIVRLEGLNSSLLESYPKNGVIQIEANSKVSILFDIRNMTTAFPEINFSKGAGAKVKITYAESLFGTNNLKGNRSLIEGKKIKGYYDIFLPDGGNNRLFRPLWTRTFRYIQFDITTAEEPLVFNKLASIFTAYPFEQKGSFIANDPLLNDIWTVGWRTARLCANETYMDCPYYEQLQYVGDTRIQALISLYVAGDDRLIRNAIEQFHQSQAPDGLTADAYPAGSSKIIPPFSLFWVSMIHDYHRYRDDPKFVDRYQVPIEAVLKWFEFQIDPKTQLLGKLGYWNFVDWSFPKQGIPPGGLEGNSSILSLQYVYTLEQAAEIFSISNSQKADHYLKLARKMKTAVFEKCYDQKTEMLADNPEKKSFSQHANIWAILTDCVPVGTQKTLMKKLMNDSTLTQTSLYYRFYFTRALKKAGLGNLYASNLQPWQEMLALGLTTFPETSSPTVRSDCHAWSASPCYDFLATICGIEPESAGFKSVRIEPNLGKLTDVSGELPHPKGQIKVSYKKLADQNYSAEIELPAGLQGHFISKGKSTVLKSGKQTLKFLR